MNASPRHQRGVALLVALLVVALATILIAALLDRGELVLARTRNALRGEQAEAYAQGLEAYAAKVLLETQNTKPDTNASPWAMPLPPQPVPGGTIGATMRDQNGCFNLNNLAPNLKGRTESAKIFRHLLAAVGLREDLGFAVEAWLDPTLSAKEANIYLAQPVPYRPRGGLFAHASELRLVRGFGGDAYARLAPYVCALPPGTKLNVNTASVPLLMSLGDKGMTRATAEKLWSGGQARYTDVKSFLQDAGILATVDLQDALAVSSTYFLARSDILLDGVPFTFYSLIERNGVRVLQRSRGADLALVAPAPIAASETP